MSRIRLTYISIEKHTLYYKLKIEKSKREIERKKCKKQSVIMHDVHCTAYYAVCIHTGGELIFCSSDVHTLTVSKQRSP